MHDEFRLVVDGLEEGPVRQVGGYDDVAHDVAQTRTGVHHRERLVDDALEEFGGLGQRLVDAIRSDDGQAVAG